MSTTAADAGRVHVITGGGGGLAVASARRLGRNGRILLSDNREERLEAAARELRAEGLDVHASVNDVVDPGSMRALATTATGLGLLGGVVNTAGVAPPFFVDGRAIVEIDLVGTAHLLDAFEPLVVDGSSGVMIASVGGHRAAARDHDELLAEPAEPDFLERLLEATACADRPLLAYALAKRGVILQCERRAKRWGERGGRLVSVSPGHIADTTMGALHESDRSPYGEIAALGRTGRAAEVAALVGFLCSEDASYVTGCDVLVDGGTRASIDWWHPPGERDAWHAAGAMSPTIPEVPS